MLFSQAAPHRIVHFGAGKQPNRILASEPKLLEAIGDDFIISSGSGQNLTQRFKWFFPQSRGIFRLNDGRVLNVITLRDDGESIWEVYTAAGGLITRTRVARAYEPFALTANGDVLATYRDEETDEAIATRLALSIK